MELVAPTLSLESSFITFFEDFSLNDVENSEHYAEGKTDFIRYVKRLKDESNGINLREDYVPCSHFWLVNGENTILGAIRVRHNIETEFLTIEAGHIGYDMAPSFRGKGYGKTMLKLAISKATALGITKILITADEDNIASRKVIEANGGEFENIVKGKVFNVPLARYWINYATFKGITT
ncbi:GNAT family N-acetyltransferase [Vibrio kyushuensis]|uniref:GNAT family N-acetyltransferase n=1 Tax=Vibrio kyushuensis TaxID=2910249 RepID=UPI003D11D0D9